MCMQLSSGRGRSLLLSVMMFIMDFKVLELALTTLSNTYMSSLDSRHGVVLRLYPYIDMWLRLHDSPIITTTIVESEELSFVSRVNSSRFFRLLYSCDSL